MNSVSQDVVTDILTLLAIIVVAAIVLNAALAAIQNWLSANHLSDGYKKSDAKWEIDMEARLKNLDLRDPAAEQPEEKEKN